MQFVAWTKLKIWDMHVYKFLLITYESYFKRFTFG